jgi:1-acyl-sn-glycerol-3-phosphate acyltransferase
MPAPVINFFATLLYWGWFTFGFLLFFSWRYCGCALLAKESETCFQRLNSRFLQVLIQLIRRTAPKQKWAIDSEAAAIRSAVIVCNHVSYLDPLLLIALFERQRTIVKPRFFTMPIFGRVITKSGYFPASSEGRFAGLMVRQMESMQDFFAGGGNLFVFPEGTRSRDGRIGELNQGAMKIARLHKVPIYVLRVANTDHLFTPGTFLFQTRVNNTISLKILARIAPDYRNRIPSAAALQQQVMEIYQANQQ